MGSTRALPFLGGMRARASRDLLHIKPCPAPGLSRVDDRIFVLTDDSETYDSAYREFALDGSLVDSVVLPGSFYGLFECRAGSG